MEKCFVRGAGLIQSMDAPLQQGFQFGGRDHWGPWSRGFGLEAARGVEAGNALLDDEDGAALCEGLDRFQEPFQDFALALSRLEELQPLSQVLLDGIHFAGGNDRLDHAQETFDD